MTLKNLSRAVCCVISMDNDPYLSDIIYSLRTDEINMRLKHSNNELKHNLKTSELPKLVLSNFNVSDETKISEDPKSNEVRFVIHDSNVIPNGETVCGLNSHVVEISTSSIDDLTETTFDYRFYTQGDSFIYLIVDVMLDIQMFYYFGLDKIFDTQEKRRTFSKQKVDFCDSSVVSSRFDRSRVFKKYCSFAFFCRNNDNTFDYKKYIDMWERFAFKINNDEHVKRTDCALEYIIKNHKFGPQLSRRKIEHLLKNCKNNEVYELVRIYKKPKSKYLKKRLSSLFGKKKVKVGTIKIVPRRVKYQYIKYARYIDVFEFTA